MQRGVQGLGTDRDRATLRTLRTAMRTASALRAGLGEDSAARAVDELRSLVDSESLVITDEERVLAWSGRFAHHTAPGRGGAGRSPRRHRGARPRPHRLRRPGLLRASPA